MLQPLGAGGRTSDITAMAQNDDPKQPLTSAGKTAEIDAFLAKVKAMPTVKAAGSKGRLIFALDATASRQATWDQACRLQGEMFEATAAIGGLDVQLVFYRGFKECRASRWLASAADLHGAMHSVSCVGGTTQIARILRHATKEARAGRVNALVFVGDAMEENVDELCQLAGELGLCGVPAFVFHEGHDEVAGRAFRQIAKLSGGAYCPFDARSAQQLRELLAAVAVYAAGGRQALLDYGKRKGGAALLLAGKVGKGDA
jgi:hypothetical protein